MCGISGIVDRNAGTAHETLLAHVRAMSDSLKHRGPDAGDEWIEAESGIAFGHRRLSIIDLSPGGAQPMTSADGRWVISYNGEVFNYLELRSELEAAGCRFRGASDTEVILEGCARWGVMATMRRLIGMFVISLWDRRTRALFLVRDRLGIKPLYYGEFDRMLIFGSELKALRAHPGWTPTIDRDALAAYFRHNYIPQPRSIYREIRKLPPGHVLTLEPGKPATLTPFWSMRDVAVKGIAEARRSKLSDAEAIEQLDTLLRDAVRRRMIADVPLGAFLSGGIDSSTVVALMQAQSNRPVRTFTIGFHEADYNEAQHAKAIARHLGTDHTELYVDPRHALDIIPGLSDWYDEPFADSSQIPTYLVSEMTRRYVTVALSGDGGDEVFAGYNRYFWADMMSGRMGFLPRAVRLAGATAIRRLSPAAWNRMFSIVPQRLRPRQPGEKIHKLADILVREDPDIIYRQIVSHWLDPATVVQGAIEPKGILWDDGVSSDVPQFLARMQFLDTMTYLPDDILTKVDRATMAVSLEGRVPLLDHRVVEFAWRLPSKFKVRAGVGKWILRRILDRYVPADLYERPKMGFGVPIDAWLRGPLRDWAEDLLSPSALAADGMLAPGPIRALWQEHLSGAQNWQYRLWVVLMFQAWRRRWPT
ncbi:MAG TPA: asparagine synthase (glutamine-hydrolyzing) [Alphaproteobacteria bacterium]|nr:asparagine synthase (glutamine-hydrolyzing) [Alphaproteobacteria bacterium]